MADVKKVDAKGGVNITSKAAVAVSDEFLQENARLNLKKTRSKNIYLNWLKR